MSDYQKRNQSVLTGKGLYIALALCLLAVGTVAYLRYANRAPVEEAVAVAPVIEVKPKQTVPVVPKPQPKKEEKIVEEPIEETVIAEPAELLPQVVSPLDGTTVTVFSMTELMYDDTMADWRTHDGLDIQAGEGDAVKTAAAGTVVSVRNDELMGTTVVIDHAGGYTTTYASLQENPPVLSGDRVNAGDIIGCVGSTAAAESGMGPHLHFSVSQDGNAIDPSEYVK